MPSLKSFQTALVYGLYNQPINRGEINPPQFIYLIDNEGDQLVSNDGGYLITNKTNILDIYLMDNEGDFLENNGGEYLVLN